jgi:serine/threonine-protein phosphatase Stp1
MNANTIMQVGQFRCSSVSHAGAVRTRNEDNFVSRPDLGLWAVADGAGGHQAGDVASRTVAEALQAVPNGLGAAQILAEVRLRIGAVHEELIAEADRRGPGAMLATTVVVLIARHDHYACLWAGDSRAYLLRGRQFAQVTHDHSLVQELLDSGEISAAEAAVHPMSNVITRAVGARGGAFALDKMTDRLRVGDRFLLCSDGLFKTVPEPELAASMSGDAGAGAEQLLAAALARHADDNVTAITVEVLPVHELATDDREVTAWVPLL